MPDVSAIIPFTIAIYIIYKNNLRNNILFKKSLYISILIFVCFLLRRTFSTAIFVLFVTTIIYNFIFIIKDLFNKKKVFIQIFNLFINLLIY